MLTTEQIEAVEYARRCSNSLFFKLDDRVVKRILHYGEYDGDINQALYHALFHPVTWQRLIEASGDFTTSTFCENPNIYSFFYKDKLAKLREFMRTHHASENTTFCRIL